MSMKEEMERKRNLVYVQLCMFVAETAFECEVDGFVPASPIYLALETQFPGSGMEWYTATTDTLVNKGWLTKTSQTLAMTPLGRVEVTKALANKGTK